MESLLLKSIHGTSKVSSEQKVIYTYDEIEMRYVNIKHKHVYSMPLELSNHIKSLA